MVCDMSPVIILNILGNIQGASLICMPFPIQHICSSTYVYQFNLKLLWFSFGGACNFMSVQIYYF